MSDWISRVIVQWLLSDPEQKILVWPYLVAGALIYALGVYALILYIDRLDKEDVRGRAQAQTEEIPIQKTDR